MAKFDFEEQRHLLSLLLLSTFDANKTAEQIQSTLWEVIARSLPLMAAEPTVSSRHMTPRAQISSLLAYCDALGNVAQYQAAQPQSPRQRDPSVIDVEDVANTETNQDITSTLKPKAKKKKQTEGMNTRMNFSNCRCHL